MKQRPRIYYTEEQKAMMWDRWQQLIIQVPAGQINWDGLFWLLFMAADKE